MKISINLFVVLFLAHSSIALAKEETFIDYDFNNTNKEGLVISQAVGVKGVHKKLSPDMLENLTGESENRALRIIRRKQLEFVHIQSNGIIPENCNYGVSLRCNLKEKGNFVISFSDADGKKIAALYFKENKLRGYDLKKKWKFTGIRITKNEWFTLNINFYPGSRNYKIKLIGQSGKSITSIPMPLLSDKTLKAVSFSTCHPIGSSALVDDLKVTYNTERVVTNRVDALEGAEIFVRNNDGSSKQYPLLNDGDIKAIALSRDIPLELNINLGKPVKVSTIRLYGGAPEYHKYPSGTCRPLSYNIEGLNTAGQWRKLASSKASKKILKGGTPESMHQQEDFEPVSIVKLKITITDSSDTLRRVSGKMAEKKVVVLREIGLWGKKLSHNQINRPFRKNIYGEFRLPVYQNQTIAGLHLYNNKKDEKDHKVKIELRERYSNKLVQKVRFFDLKYGKNIIEFQLDKLPDGEYAASVIDQNDPMQKGDKFRRLLRLQRLVNRGKRNTPILLATGKKMFFPDAYYLDKHENIIFSSAQAKMEQVVSPNSVSEGFIRHGSQIFFDKSGKMYLPFYTVDRFWSKKSKKNFIAVSSKQGQWKIAKMEPSYISNKVKQKSPINSQPPNAAKPDWSVKLKDGKPPVFRFYDPQKDGKVNLRQVCFEYKRRYSGTVLGSKKKSLNWKIVNPPPCSTWPVWYKAPGEAILLTRTPLLQDKMPYGEFEEKIDSNDNFVGQWLSDDGKTLSYARCRLLKRYPPFTAPYDNLASCARILSIISTTDGMNWKYSYMVPPDKNDPPVAQHYGARVFRIPGGNGLMQAFVYRYHAKSQRISIELAYSWDGAKWQRYSGKPAFAKNGKLGCWNAGMLMISSSAIAREGTVYQMLSWVCEGFHFYGDFYYNRSNMKEITGEKIKKYFKGRDLESWPFFKHFGGYDGIAADIRKAGVSVGIASYRKDGLFYMSPQGTGIGKFVSRMLTASAGMTANAVIGQGGFLSIDLIDNTGKVIPGYTKELSSSDSLSSRIFDILPDKPFRVRAKLKNTKLYSLNF